MKQNGYKLDIEHRVTQTQEAIVRIDNTLEEIKTNHLAHIQEDIQELRKRMSWGVGVAITVLCGVVVDLALKLVK